MQCHHHIHLQLKQDNHICCYAVQEVKIEMFRVCLKHFSISNLPLNSSSAVSEDISKDFFCKSEFSEYSTRTSVGVMKNIYAD